MLDLTTAEIASITLLMVVSFAMILLGIGIWYSAVKYANETLERLEPLPPVLTPTAEDFFLWPDGDICMREDGPFDWKSDDYEVIHFDTPRWHELAREHGFA